MTAAERRGPRPGDRRPDTSARAWGVVALVLALLPIVLAWLPLVTEVTATTSSTGPDVVTSRRRSLIGAEGVLVLLPMVVPALVAAVPLAVARTARAPVARWAAAGVLGAGCVAALASIGVFYLPALLALLAAAVTGRRRSTDRAGGPPGSPDR